MKPSAIVIGAGIAGLATARALAARGVAVRVFERSSHAVGASVRNFGMVWPIGQPNGGLYEQAMLSRSIWKQICTEAHIWHSETGSLHLAYSADELLVMEEYTEQNKPHRNCALLNAADTLKKSPAVNASGLKGSLWSADELIVEARMAIGQLAAYLVEKYDVEFYWDTAITRIQNGGVYSAVQSWQADEVYVCSGADFETLYPRQFAESGITKCKLQMMRLAAQPGNWCIGPSLCGGLSMIHYKGFAGLASLDALQRRYDNDYADYLKWGIHVMVSQNAEGELTIGDSHEYGLTHDPFDKEFINRMILDYLKTFAAFKNWQIIQTWNGIYPKLTDGRTSLILEPEDGVTIINGLGGAGMTLAFGLAEEVIGRKKVVN